MPKLRNLTTIQSRIYSRSRGGPLRYYADFRDFADVGGRQEPLAPAGKSQATTDPAEAKRLAEARLAAYTARRAAAPTTTGDDRQFAKFAVHHLEQKALNEEARPQWLESATRHLKAASAYFGATTDLAEIKVRNVSEYVAHLRSRPNGRGGKLESGSVVHFLNSLSNMFDRAISEDIIPMGMNPVSRQMAKPKIRRKETEWLEIPEMAAILAFARTHQPRRKDAIPYFYAILAGFALTGCRESELLGLEVVDVNLARQVLHVRPNSWRRLKTQNSARSIPIPSQLANIWAAYLSGPYRPTGRLMFPALRGAGGPERMITDLRKSLDRMPMPARLARERTVHEMKKAEDARLAMLARWDSSQSGPKPKVPREELLKPVSSTVVPPLRTKMLRHTFCAARLQTLDRGEPISPYTVAMEMGHEDTKMVKKVYGHLGKIRIRGSEVEYR